MTTTQQTQARRFEWYVRWSFYAIVGASALHILSLAAVASKHPIVAGVTVLITIAQTIMSLLVARWCLGHMLGRTGWQEHRRFLAVWVLATLLLAGLRLWAGDQIASFMFCVVLAVAALTPVLSVRETWWTSLALALGIAATLAATSDRGQPFWWLPVLLMVVWVGFIVWSAWLTAWMLRVQQELQRSHVTESALALAEERLRISRDLHDVFGRSLAVISVKSELAAELARRGRNEEAAAEMATIRGIANDAGTEVRKVVRGEQSSSFEVEVAGAKALLSSAGVTVTIVLAEAPVAYAEPLGWVVREGVTNILRHSNADRATIALDVADTLTLTLSNNGCNAPAPLVGGASGGTGLTSMSARVESLGGTLTHVREGDWFTLTAVLPSPSAAVERAGLSTTPEESP